MKGDGSDQFGSLAVKGRFSFVTFFPLKNTEWHQVVVPWRDFVTEYQAEPIGTFGAILQEEAIPMIYKAFDNQLLQGPHT